jgi:hypothetical protein
MRKERSLVSYSIQTVNVDEAEKTELHFAITIEKMSLV